MWFKQLTVYPLAKGKIPTKEALEKAVSEALFCHCSGLEWYSEGFALPNDAHSDELVFLVQGSLKVALKKEDKVLPNSVINDVLAEKVQLIEQEETRVIGRKEKQALKEQIVDDLLPRALTKSSTTQAIFDQKRSLLLINQASTTKAESMLTKLRQCLGGLDARLPRTQMSPSELMTEWLDQGEASGQFVLDSDCVLSGAGEAAAIVRMSKQDLTADEVTKHLENKTVTQLGLLWSDKIRFILTSELTLKRIQFLDMLQEEANQEGEDKETLMAASQMIMVASLGEMLEEIFQLLGGLEN